MSRYFVVLPGAAHSAPFVIAEVVREQDDDGHFREESLAANLAGADALVLTREELEATGFGRAALRRWGVGDDSSFDGDAAGPSEGLGPGDLEPGVPRSGDEEGDRKQPRRHLRSVGP